MAVFVGVDWGCGAHAVCVIDAKGMVLDRFEVGHDRAGLAALVTRLHQHAARRFSSLKLWAMAVAERGGMKRAKVALVRKLASVLHRMCGSTARASASARRSPPRDPLTRSKVRTESNVLLHRGPVAGRGIDKL